MKSFPGLSHDNGCLTVDIDIHSLWCDVIRLDQHAGRVGIPEFIHDTNKCAVGTVSRFWWLTPSEFEFEIQKHFLRDCIIISLGEMHADVIYAVRLKITIDLYFRVSFSDLFGEIFNKYRLDYWVIECFIVPRKKYSLTGELYMNNSQSVFD